MGVLEGLFKDKGISVNLLDPLYLEGLLLVHPDPDQGSNVEALNPAECHAVLP